MTRPEGSAQREEPRPGLDGEAAHHAAYLDFYRRTCIEKCRALPAAELRTSRLPSGWTPLEMLAHLYFMERRWFVWGFLGEDVDDVWGDGADRWRVPDDVTLADLAGRLHALGVRVSGLLAEHRLEEIAPPGPRFEDGQPATLAWICFHVLQEYARHAGHLDVAVELAGGVLGE